MSKCYPIPMKSQLVRSLLHSGCFLINCLYLALHDSITIVCLLRFILERLPNKTELYRIMKIMWITFLGGCDLYSSRKDCGGVAGKRDQGGTLTVHSPWYVMQTLIIQIHHKRSKKEAYSTFNVSCQNNSPANDKHTYAILELLLYLRIWPRTSGLRTDCECSEPDNTGNCYNNSTHYVSIKLETPRDTHKEHL